MSATLPKLLDRKTLAAELGITPAQAESVMRRCPTRTGDRAVNSHSQPEAAE